MPELPEVEEVRRTLVPHLLRARVTGVRVLRRDFIRLCGSSMDQFVGQGFASIHRHGKNLFMVAADGRTLHLHLGMTGRVDCLPADAAVAKHTHVILELAGGTHVRFRDPRRFGGMACYPSLDAALAAEIRGLGPDALELTPLHLAHWRHTRGRLKARLLGQRDVAGLGNIYVDEALWLTRLHPLQRVSRLKPAQIDELVAIIRRILRRSIRMGGTTLRDYRNAADQPGRFAQELQAYGRGGSPCRRCRAILVSLQVASRTTVYCPACQRRK